MDNVDPFDKKLDIRGPYIPNEVKDSAIWVNDTLDLCWASAQSVFGEQATPELAVAILDKVMAKIAMDRQALALRHRRHNDYDEDYDEDYSDEF